MLPHTEPTPSYWNTPPIPISRSRPSPSNEPSIVIIGSGLAAAAIAYAILPLLPTAHVLVLEARSVCDGATGRNGGHCKVVPHEELDKLTPRFGVKRAVELVRFQMRHLECLREVCELVDGTSGEKTEFREVETVDLYVDEGVFYEARGKVERMRAVMPDVDVKVWTAEEAKQRFGVSSSCHGAISYRAAALYPYRLVTALWNHLIREYPSRLTIQSHTPVTSITAESEAPFRVHTRKGAFLARHVIHATNAYASHLLPKLKDHIVPVRAHMTAQRPGSHFPRVSGGRSWSVIYGCGFDYVTQRPSADGAGDLLVGGGWARSPARGADAIGVFDDSEVEPITVRYLEGILPTLFEPNWGMGAGVDMAWSGIIAVTPDTLPFVGNLSPVVTERPVRGRCTGDGSFPAEWIAAGFNGEGMVFAFLSGVALAALVSGRESQKAAWKPGVPSRRVEEWFPAELFVSEERLRGRVRRDPEGLFSCPAFAGG